MASACQGREEKKEKEETKEADVEVEAASSDVAKENLLDGVTKTRGDERSFRLGAVEEAEVNVDPVRRDVESHGRVLAQRESRSPVMWKSC